MLARLVPAVILSLLATVALAPTPATAQSRLLRQGDQPDLPVDAATRRAVTVRFAEEIERSYVIADQARSLGGALRRRAASDHWKAVAGSRAFADSLTAYAQSVTHDLHLRVFYSHEDLPAGSGATLPSPEVASEEQRWTRTSNHGIAGVRRLPGNVGVIEIREFLAGSDAKYAAAMELVRDTDALILDLREARGGRPEVATLVASYLLADPPVLLNMTWNREAAETTRVWSRGDLPGPRYSDRPVTVLTSRRTFSAGEMLAGTLQRLGRVAVVGDTTGGGGHGMNFRTLHPHFAAGIPFIKPLLAVWEGTGVRPDRPAPDGDALRVAHGAALRALADAAPSDARRNELSRMAADLEQGREPQEPGQAGGRRVMRR